MGQASILKDIETAKEAIGAAETELQAAVADTAVGRRADKVKVSEVVRTASLKLSAAKAKLVELESVLEAAKLAAAQTVIEEAELHLDEVLRDIEVVDGADTTMVTKVVRNAFRSLRIAKTKLAELEAGGTDED